MYPTVIYGIGGERVPYLDSFCKIEENNYIATSIYYYEKGERTLRGVNEKEYSVNLIPNSDI